MNRVALALALTPLALGACAHRAPKPVVTVEAAPPQPTGWRAIAAAEDQARIEQIPATWTRARWTS